MREIKSGDQTMRIRASNMARFYFYQEFNSDLGEELDKIMAAIQSQDAMKQLEQISPEQLKEFTKLQDINNVSQSEALEILEKTGLKDDQSLMSSLLVLAANGGSTQIPGIPLMKVVWAMNRAENEAEESPTPAFDQWVERYDEFDFVSAFDDIYMEIRRGFFRSENKQKG